MPKRTDIQKILVIGSGPIVIGQACEFDYSGTQAVRALRREGYRVVLVNSNPATIMTDPELADATYIEPLTVPFLERIIEKERPDALLPTVGGQTGLNLSLALADAGILDKWSVQLIGASREAVRVAEDRDLFKQAMVEIGAEVPRSERARSLEDALRIAREIGRASCRERVWISVVAVSLKKKKKKKEDAKAEAKALLVRARLDFGSAYMA